MSANIIEQREIELDARTIACEWFSGKPFSQLTESERADARAEAAAKRKRYRPACVVVEYDPSPISARDFMAYQDGCEEQQRYGLGATRVEAVENLFALLEDLHD